MTTQLDYLSAGTFAGCTVCQQQHGMGETELRDATSAGQIADDPAFSWSACELCGEPSGGNRYTAHGRDGGADGEIVHLDVCESCLMAL